jgi:hypothetical protein
VEWTRSSRCDTGNCVEWRKSTYSDCTGTCVEVQQPVPGNVMVRDSKKPDGSILVFTNDEWRAFVLGVKAGEFDV